MSSWPDDAPGVLCLPSGRRVRGRSLRQPEDRDDPHFGLYLGRRDRHFEWDHEWLPWPDFLLPRDRNAFAAAVLVAWKRAAHERVEVACTGGRGRTGTALACMAIIDGVAPTDAVSFVRSRYDKRAVETPWQRLFVRRFVSPHPGSIID